MIVDTIHHVIAAVPPEHFQAADPKTGREIASSVKGFVAPIAALLIGIFSLRYIAGENKSMGAFIGFVVLGIFVYALIQYGEVIVGPLSGVLKGWVVGD